MMSKHLRRSRGYNELYVRMKGYGLMKVPVVFRDGEDGFVVVECPVLPGCISQGSTEAEAYENIKEAISLCIEVRKEMGLPLTLRSREVEVAL
jgi:predicted RNase H-like HicB family nuclease